MLVQVVERREPEDSVMSDRVEKKLQEVVVAEYRYRHEAEFAAGFLDDAGIPYRLQIDDPGLGMMVSTPATIWVRGMDVEHAREILEVGNQVVAPTQVAAPNREWARPRQSRAGTSLAPSHLTIRERLLTAVGAAGFIWLAWYLVEGSASETAARLAAIPAILLVAAAISGRAPRALKRLLTALSGIAP
jgi:hypothetical protein